MKTTTDLLRKMIIETQIAAAFIMEGVNDAGYDEFCKYTDIDGCLEKVMEAVTAAGCLGMACLYACEHGIDFGVFHYEVSSTYGFLYAKKAIELKSSLTAKEKQGLLRGILENATEGYDPKQVRELFEFIELENMV